MDGCGLDRIPADHEQNGRDGSVDDSFGDRADDGVIRDADGVCALVAVAGHIAAFDGTVDEGLGSRILRIGELLRTAAKRELEANHVAVYRRTLDKLRLKLLESGVIHTVTLKQTECRKRNKKIAAAVYLYQADNDGEWGEIRFDFENGTAEIVKMADWDTVKSYVFAKAAIRFVQSLPETRLLKSTVVPFEMERLDLI